MFVHHRAPRPSLRGLIMHSCYNTLRIILYNPVWLGMSKSIIYSGNCTTLAKTDLRRNVIQRFSTYMYTSTIFKEKRDSDKGNKNTVTECDHGILSTEGET